MATVVANVVLNVTLVRLLGYRGLALGTSLAALFNASVLLVLLRRHLDGLEDAYEPGRLMGSFAEDCADRYGFSRAEQDAFALRSHQRALAAITGLVRPSDMGLRGALIADTMPPDTLTAAMGISRTTSDTARIAGDHQPIADSPSISCGMGNSPRR